ncbi:MAG: hypothetical protein ACJ71R_05620 [Nitrososphaeraceae archaeon]
MAIVTIALGSSPRFVLNTYILLVLLLLGTTINIGNLLLLPSHIPEVYAQMMDHNSTRSPTPSNIDSLNAAIESNTTSTFSATGPISSLVITVPESDFNITNAFKVVLTGAWNLTVNSGNVSDLAIQFIASPMDGRMPHIHQITDFRPYDDAKPITLTEDASLSLNGTADIKINDKVVWEDADVSVSISKGNVFIFDPDDADTDNHFGHQQVYGIIAHLTT